MSLCKLYHKHNNNYLCMNLCKLHCNPIYNCLCNQYNRCFYILFCKCLGNHFRMYQCTNQYMFPYKLICIHSCIFHHKWNHTQRNNYPCILQNNRYNLRKIVEDNRRMKMKMKMNWTHCIRRYFLPNMFVCNSLCKKYNNHHCSLYDTHKHIPYSMIQKSNLMLHCLLLLFEANYLT